MSETLLLDLTDDSYVGSLSSEIIGNFVCMLCYGIVIDPIKCLKCDSLFCKRCVNKKRLERGKLKCYKKCGGSKFTFWLNKQELGVYQNLKFKCPNECSEPISFKHLYAHLLKKCPIKTYSKIDLPDGAMMKENDGAEVKEVPLIGGVMAKMFLEEGEELDEY